MGSVSRWRLVRVQGASMVPTLRHGDLVLVDEGRAVAAGQVVIGRFDRLPEHLVVKRAVATGTDAAAGPPLWYLGSDNPFAGGDSAVHGLASVEGTVRWRWNRTLVLPRRPRSAPER